MDELEPVGHLRDRAWRKIPAAKTGDVVEERVRILAAQRRDCLRKHDERFAGLPEEGGLEAFQEAQEHMRTCPSCILISKLANLLEPIIGRYDHEHVVKTG